MKVEVIKDGKVIHQYNQSVESLVPSKHDTITIGDEQYSVIARKIETTIENKRGHHSVRLYV